MLEVVVRAALCTLLLALVVQLCLWGLRVRHATLQLATWTAVLVASLAMPVLQRVVPTALPAPLLSFSLAKLVDPATPAPHSALPEISDGGATVTRAADTHQTFARLESHKTFAWSEWLAKAYVFVACAMLLRLMLGLAFSLRMLHAAHPVRADWAAGRKIRASAAVRSPVTIGDNTAV